MPGSAGATSNVPIAAGTPDRQAPQDVGVLVGLVGRHADGEELALAVRHEHGRHRLAVLAGQQRVLRAGPVELGEQVGDALCLRRLGVALLLELHGAHGEAADAQDRDQRERGGQDAGARGARATTRPAAGTPRAASPSRRAGWAAGRRAHRTRGGDGGRRGVCGGGLRAGVGSGLRAGPRGQHRRELGGSATWSMRRVAQRRAAGRPARRPHRGRRAPPPPPAQRSGTRGTAAGAGSTSISSSGSSACSAQPTACSFCGQGLLAGRSSRTPREVGGEVAEQRTEDAAQALHAGEHPGLDGAQRDAGERRRPPAGCSRRSRRGPGPGAARPAAWPSASRTWPATTAPSAAWSAPGPGGADHSSPSSAAGTVRRRIVALAAHRVDRLVVHERQQPGAERATVRVETRRGLARTPGTPPARRPRRVPSSAQMRRASE